MRLCITIIFVYLSFVSLSQDGKYQLGAASSAMGGSSITIADAWSIFNNVGALGSLNETTAFASYQNRYNVSGFQVVGGGFVHSTDIGTAGMAYYRFGDGLFSQQRLTLAIGNRFQMVSLGGAANIVQFQAEGLETRRRVAIEFGGVAEIIPQLTFGAHIFNLSNDELVPTVMKAGISYRPSDQLMINLETEKELGFAEVLKVGLQYQIIEALHFRTGLSTRPFRSAFGFGILLSGFLLDYAYVSNPDLGGIHEVSIGYKINKD